MTVRREPREVIARRARRLSGRERMWAEELSPIPNPAEQTEWVGDNDQKIAMLRAWAATLEARPRVVDVMNRYKLSKDTAIKFHKLAFRDEG